MAATAFSPSITRASTDRELTVYYAKVPAQHLETALQVLGEMTLRPLFNSDELEKKMSGFAVGGNSVSLVASEPAGSCSTCGDPRGAGACAWD